MFYSNISLFPIVFQLKITTKDEWHKLTQLLTEFQMRSVDFLYSNLEFILPLPVNIFPELKPLHGSSESPNPSTATNSAACPARKNPREQPGKKMPKRKQKKKIVTLDDSDLFDSDLSFPEESVSLSPVSISSISEDKESDPDAKKLDECLVSSAESAPHPPTTPAEKQHSALVSRCLSCLTEFLDNMSFLDALLTDITEQKELGKNDFRWTRGKVKSGLCDEFSLESGDNGWAARSSAEVKAAAEALSFTKCSSALSKALETVDSCKKLGSDPTSDLSIYVSQKRDSVHFNQSAANLE